MFRWQFNAFDILRGLSKVYYVNYCTKHLLFTKEWSGLWMMASYWDTPRDIVFCPLDVWMDIILPQEWPYLFFKDVLEMIIIIIKSNSWHVTTPRLTAASLSGWALEIPQKHTHLAHYRSVFSQDFVNPGGSDEVQ